MQRNHSIPQFSLAELFACTTACTIPLAFVSALGVPCSLLLVATAVALAARQGFAAIGLLMAASIATDLRANPTDYVGSDVSVWRQVCVGGVAVILCGWYQLRRMAAQ